MSVPRAVPFAISISESKQESDEAKYSYFCAIKPRQGKLHSEVALQDYSLPAFMLPSTTNAISFRIAA